VPRIPIAHVTQNGPTLAVDGPKPNPKKNRVIFDVGVFSKLPIELRMASLGLQ
jgi:hypothetical protein